MKSETIGELNIALAHLAEKLEDHIENSKDSHDKIMNSIQELSKTCDLTLQQAVKTNGRVNVIEPLALDYQENRARFRGAVIIVALLGTTLVGSAAFIGKLYVDSTQQHIATMVVAELESKYDITYEKNSTKTK